MDIRRKPAWLKVNLSSGTHFAETSKILEAFKLATVCISAKCPNRGDCWARKSAAFMILGKNCTRACRFCAVSHLPPEAVDETEPLRLANAAKEMGLKHITITSVTRDDLPDFGAAHWAKTASCVKSLNPDSILEILVPDFGGNTDLVDIVLNARPDIFNHNLETVKELQKTVRGKADYATSLKILKHAADRNFCTKSGIMLGLGETQKQIENTILDLKNAGVKMLTIGQYIAPSPQHIKIDRWAEPDEFEFWRKFALNAGFEDAQCAPLVRSSYLKNSDAL